MAVPEATIYENHFVSRRKNDVRRSRQVPPVESKPVAERVQQSPDHEFRRGVFSANTRHQGAAALRGPIVRHGS